LPVEKPSAGWKPALRSFALNSPQIVASLTPASDGERAMAKGQMRTNKEKRKPKKEKDAKKK